MSLEHLSMPASKEVLKIDGPTAKEPFEAQRGFHLSNSESLSIKMDNDRNTIFKNTHESIVILKKKKKKKCKKQGQSSLSLKTIHKV